MHLNNSWHRTRRRAVAHRRRVGGMYWWQRLKERCVARKKLPRNLWYLYSGIYRSPRECQRHIYNKHCNDAGFCHVSHAAEAECIKGDGEVEWGGLDAHPSLMQPWQTRWKFGPTANLHIVELYYVSNLKPRWASMEAPSKVGYTRMESDQE